MVKDKRTYTKKMEHGHDMSYEKIVKYYDTHQRSW